MSGCPCVAGAQLAGLEQDEAAEHVLDKMRPSMGGGGQGCPGVVFYAAAGSGEAGAAKRPQGWYVMDQQKHCLPKSRSPIREADSFVLFDEARCRCDESLTWSAHLSEMRTGGSCIDVDMPVMWALGASLG